MFLLIWGRICLILKTLWDDLKMKLYKWKICRKLLQNNAAFVCHDRLLKFSVVLLFLSFIVFAGVRRMWMNVPQIRVWMEASASTTWTALSVCVIWITQGSTAKWMSVTSTCTSSWACGRTSSSWCPISWYDSMTSQKLSGDSTSTNKHLLIL